MLVDDTDPAAILLQCQVNLLQLLLQTLRPWHELMFSGFQHGKHEAALLIGMSRFAVRPHANTDISMAELTLICASSALFSAFANGGRKDGSSSPSASSAVLIASVNLPGHVPSDATQGNRAAELYSTLGKLFLLLGVHG